MCPCLRGQFCCERFPPERDGGLWEVQRSGSQAEERAGMRFIYFVHNKSKLHSKNLFFLNIKKCSYSIFLGKILGKSFKTFSRERIGINKYRRSAHLFWVNRILCFVLSEKLITLGMIVTSSFTALWRNHSSLTVLNLEKCLDECVKQFWKMSWEVFFDCGIKLYSRSIMWGQSGWNGSCFSD